MKKIIKRNELFIILILSVLIIIININPLLVNAAIYNVSNRIGTYTTEYQVRDYNVDYSEHFIYKYNEIDQNILQIVKNNAEKSFYELVNYFEYTPNKKITIIIFPSIRSMNTILRLPENQQSMGLYYSEFISILSPNVWIQNEDINIMDRVFEKSGPMVHELTHYFVDKKTNGNYPIWLTEGTALYFENIITGFEWGQGKAYKNQKYTIDELTNNFENLNQDYAYKSSFEIISKYVENNGIYKLLNIMDKLGEGYSLDDFGI